MLARGLKSRGAPEQCGDFRRHGGGLRLEKCHQLSLRRAQIAAARQMREDPFRLTRVDARCGIESRFVDGRRSNPHNTTKVNLLADSTDPAAQKASQIAMAALQRSEPAKNFVFPQRMARPSLCS